MESNPEEFKQGNKWSYVLPKESGGFADWGHALTKAELNALSEGIRKIASGTFTDIVMSTLLEDKEEVLRYRTTERYTYGMTDPQTLAQNTIQPGSWQEVATQTSNTSIAKVLKNALGIK
jgi:hypothetical protein